MIEGIHNGIIRILGESDFAFFLTGSRYFGAPDPKDWDFFTLDWPEVREFLASQGFQELSAAKYRDSNCVAVFRGHFPGTEQVDIQFVKFTDLKMDAQRILKELGIVRPTRANWETIFDLLRERTK